MNKSSTLLSAVVAGVLGSAARPTPAVAFHMPTAAPSTTVKAKRPPVPTKAPKFNPNMNALKTTQMRKAMGRRS